MQRSPPKQCDRRAASYARAGDSRDRRHDGRDDHPAIGRCPDGSNLPAVSERGNANHVTTKTRHHFTSG